MALDEAQSLVAYVDGQAAIVSRLGDAAVADTGRVKNIWRLQLAWTDMCPCAPATTTSSRNRMYVSRGSRHTGSNLVEPEAWLVRPTWMIVTRIGEAKNPGPLVCTCNPGGWSRAEGLLSMGHNFIPPGDFSSAG
eukprot:3627199-Amphidinium_carterae.2